MNIFFWVFYGIVFFMQYFMIILILSFNGYKTKKHFYRDCIPFYWLFYIFKDLYTIMIPNMIKGSIDKFKNLQ